MTGLADSVRTVTVPPARLGRWLDGFARRHGAAIYSWADDAVQLSSPDGAEARIVMPFPPLLGRSLPGDLLDHVLRERAIGALLVRLGGTAVGVFHGARLVDSKVETHYVQSRTKAGGWSQQRYARRRGNQAREVTTDAADLVYKIILPVADGLDAIVAGGDKSVVAAVLADQRLEPLRPLVQARVHPVPDPRLVVLQAFPEQFLAVEISLNALA